MEIPDVISLLIRSNNEQLSDWVEVILNAYKNSALPAISVWAVPANAKRKKTSTTDVLTKLSYPNSQNIEFDSIAFESNDIIFGSLYHPYKSTEWEFTLNIQVNKKITDDVPHILKKTNQIVRTVIEHKSFLNANISFKSAGANCMPVVPIAKMKTFLVTTTHEEVNLCYTNPKEFWDSGWDKVEWMNGYAILERAMNTKNTTDYLEKAIPHQDNLMRIAKAGLCKFGFPAVLPSEEKIYFAGTPTLQIVGYDAINQEVEFSCPFKPPRQVLVREIFNIYKILRTKALPDGQAVKSIRIVFLYEQMAQEEKRPLLDVGAKVLYYDQNGILCELVE